MRAFPFITVIVVAWAATVSAQPAPPLGGTGERGSIPPGTSRDESQPSEGAITGGSVAGPEHGRAVESDPALQQEINRCKQLEGALREQCLRDLAGASAGGTRAPQPGLGRDPATSPPPQNPQPQ